MGGGGETGGTVVGGPSPAAAALAGQYQVAAANAAADAMQRSISDAINAMNKQYMTARADVQPYRTEGVQALNQLNQYIGLSPYNPGPAPTAPKKYTATDLANQISNSEIRNYILQNTGMVGVKNNHGQTFQHLQYSGAGADDPGLMAAFAGGWTNTPAGEKMPGGGLTMPDSNDNSYGSGFSPFAQNKAIQNFARLELANDLANQKNATYDTQLEAYNRDLAEYNQNKAWYDQYSAEGPLTTQQISDKISNLPGYQAQLTQGIDAIQKSASAKGYLGSGRLLKELNQYGQNTLSTFYGNELGRLAQLAGAGQQAANTSAGLASTLGGNTANLYATLGDTKANAALASGNALAQALLAGNQEYRVIGQQSTGGGGLGGIGSVLGGIGSIASAFSSKKLKNKKSTPSTKAILESIKNLDLDTWEYKKVPGQTFYGPYAEDVKRKFKIGDGKSINLINLVGVLFGATKELATQVDKVKGELANA